MIVAISHNNPFNPGEGTIPSHFAGRAAERRAIEESLLHIHFDKVTDGLVPAPGPTLVVQGPRGVGKTVLARLAINQAMAMGIHIANLSKFDLTGSNEGLVRVLTPDSRIKKLVGLLKHVNASASVANQFSVRIGPSGMPVHTDLKSLLAAGSLAGPMLVLLDEAHTMPPVKLNELCIACHELSGARLPLQLVLAGTPGLAKLLMDMEGSFMERARMLPVNLLSDEEAREALSKGFAGTGMKVEPDALDRMAEWTDNYPYFIQLAGAAVWEVVNQKGNKVVSVDDTNAGLAGAEDRRNYFFDGRHTELLKSGIKPQALQVIGMLRDSGEGLSDEKIMEGLMKANLGMDSKHVLDVIQELKDLGFIYKEDKHNQAGIPSLFDYVADYDND